MEEKNKELKSVPFFMVPGAVLESGNMKPGVFMVYCCLLKYRNNKNCSCWPSVKTIAKECCMCENTVRAAIEKLEELKFIKKEKRKNKSNVYKEIVGVNNAKELGECLELLKKQARK